MLNLDSTRFSITSLKSFCASIPNDFIKVGRFCSLNPLVSLAVLLAFVELRPLYVGSSDKVKLSLNVEGAFLDTSFERL